MAAGKSGRGKRQVGTAAISLMRIQAAQPWRSDLSYLTANML